jgi:hypothetical protein
MLAVCADPGPSATPALPPVVDECAQVTCAPPPQTTPYSSGIFWWRWADDVRACTTGAVLLPNNYTPSHHFARKVARTPTRLGVDVTVIKCPSPPKMLKRAYDHSCYM